MTAVVVKGQIVFHQGIPGTVVETGRGWVIVELDTGRVLIVAENEVESPKSAQDRQRPS